MLAVHLCQCSVSFGNEPRWLRRQLLNAVVQLRRYLVGVPDMEGAMARMRTLAGEVRASDLLGQPSVQQIPALSAAAA